MGLVRHEFSKDVPDSGQEYLTHSDDGFFVTTASLDLKKSANDGYKEGKIFCYCGI